MTQNVKLERKKKSLSKTEEVEPERKKRSSSLHSELGPQSSQCIMKGFKIIILKLCTVTDQHYCYLLFYY